MSNYDDVDKLMTKLIIDELDGAIPTNCATCNGKGCLACGGSGTINIVYSNKPIVSYEKKTRIDNKSLS